MLMCIFIGISTWACVGARAAHLLSPPSLPALFPLLRGTGSLPQCGREAGSPRCSSSVSSQQLWNASQGPHACGTSSPFLLIHGLIVFLVTVSPESGYNQGALNLQPAWTGQRKFQNGMEAFMSFVHVFNYDTLLFGNNLPAQERILLLFNVKMVVVEFSFGDRKGWTNAGLSYPLQNRLDISVHHNDQ